MGDLTARSVREAAVSHVLVRGCARCQHPRVVGEPCAGCGNPEPPVVHELGVQSYYHRNPLRRAWWSLIGQRQAARRAREAQQYKP